MNLALLAEYNFPRRVPKDFFATNRPSEDIFLSGGHRFLVLQPSFKEFIKIPSAMFKNLDAYEIKDLEVLKQITHEESPRYYHIELENPEEGVIACGIAVESLEAGKFQKGKFIENL